MSCFCTGECQRLGYCPNQVDISGMYPKACKKCGRPIKVQSIYDTCIHCRNENVLPGGCDKSDEFDLPDLPDYSMEFKINEGDEIWFKREGDDTVFHLYVAEVKGNVFKTSTSEEGAKRYRVTADYSWWEFDNIRILEIEKQNNE